MPTDRNILANLEQTGIWIPASFKEGAEIVIAPLPMYHTLPHLDAVVHEVGQPQRADHQSADLPAFVKEMGNWKTPR